MSDTTRKNTNPLRNYKIITQLGDHTGEVDFGDVSISAFDGMIQAYDDEYVLIGVFPADCSIVTEIGDNTLVDTPNESVTEDDLASANTYAEDVIERLKEKLKEAGFEDVAVKAGL